jgi:hypothetical protein
VTSFAAKRIIATPRRTGDEELNHLPIPTALNFDLRHEHDVVWPNEPRARPARTVEDQQGDGPDADAFVDVGAMFVDDLDSDLA